MNPLFLCAPRPTLRHRPLAVVHGPQRGRGGHVAVIIRAEGMHYSVNQYTHAAVITLEGTVLGGPDKVAALQAIQGVLARGTRYLIFDVSRARYFSSAGLGLLVTALKMARGVGGDACLTGVRRQLNELLTTTNLDRILRVYATVEEAALGYQQYQATVNAWAYGYGTSPPPPQPRWQQRPRY